MIRGAGTTIPKNAGFLNPEVALARSIALAAVLSLAALTDAFSQQPAFELSIPSIMRGPEIVGHAPEQIRWTADGRWIYFLWVPPGTDWRERLRPYRIAAAAGATPEPVTLAHLDSVAPLIAPGRWNRVRTARIVAAGGDLYLVPRGAALARRLSETAVGEEDPRFSADGSRVYYRQGNNGFAVNLAGGAIQQLTDIRTGNAPREDSSAAGQRGVLERQQRELFQSVRDRLRNDSLEKADRRTRESWRVKPYYLGENTRLSQLSLSPNGRAAFLVTTAEAKPRSSAIPSYVTVSGYTEDLTARSNVGDAQERRKLGVMQLPSGAVRWLSWNADDSARGIDEADLVDWSPDGAYGLLRVQSADFKRRSLFRISADSGTSLMLDQLTDSAWVGGPCSECAGWYDEGRRVWFVSEADGYAHLYSVAADGSDRRQLTRGEWEVLSVSLSADGRFFYLETSESSPYEQQLVRMPVAGGPRQPITTARGGHSTVLSPDQEWIADLHSTANRPPELFLQRNRPGASATQLTVSPTSEWLGFPWIVPEIVRVPASDGVLVPARIYRPADVGGVPNGAGVIFVHGAGYLHNVTNTWSYYYREFMFHHLLARAGYVVLDLDYRGSAGYGRDWRTAIYRHMGGRDLQDQVDGSKYLQRQFGIDPERIGIYGGSYGGFITLMALFTEPRSFGAGAALRSVTDWAHYNHGYTGAILNLPQDDSTAYRRSSPIYFAEGLEDPLLMAHGMVDDNVHFQDVVRLSQRLIELGKTDWELAVYPVESHSFVRPDSWTDEYRRIFELFQRTIGRKPAESGGTRR